MSSVREEKADPTALSPSGFARFARFITAELGIKMPEAKVPMLQSRLMRRLHHLQLRSIEEYQDYLFSSPNAAEECVHFIDAVTTHKTDFFREPQHFDYLRRTVLPGPNGSAGAGAPHRFKLWCAGCSSGEEPYSLAMVLRDYSKQCEGFDFAILATDISAKVLDQARAAIYDESRIEPVPAALRANCLMRSRDPSRRLIRIIPELRARIAFRRLNFMDDDYGVKEVFDVIFFRNVMIYFDKPTQQAVVGKLCRHLRPGGYLFVGHSESLAGLDIPVALVASAVFRKPLHQPLS